MSNAVFPSTSVLPGFWIEITRTAAWDTIVQQAVSGKETRVNRRQYPRRTWDIKFNFLRSSTTYLELQALEGFFDQRQGMFDSFLWTDPEDFSSSGAALGNGDSTNKNFQLLRSYGGWLDQITAPNTVTRFQVDSTILTSTMYAVGAWGSTAPGIVQVSTFAPPAGQAITADFTFYWPVRFTIDDMSFDRMVSMIWEAKKVSFISIL